MAITFNDTNYIYITNQQVVVPPKIVSDTALVADTTIVKANYLTLDNTNTIPYDYYHSVIDYYHSELLSLTGISHTQYLTSYTTSSGKGNPSVHYPTEPTPYVNFNPMKLPSNTGSPTSNAQDSQQKLINDIRTAINTFTTNYTNAERVTGPPLVTVPNPTPPPPTIQVPDGAFSIQADAVDAAVSTFSVRLSSYAAILATLPSSNSGEILSRDTASTQANTTILALNGYLAIPIYGRYSDANLNAVLAAITAQETQNNNRNIEIFGYLGTLSQDSSGNFTGNGYYYTFFIWIDLRINRTVGSLTLYYNTDLVIKFLNDTIAANTRMMVEYSTYATTTALLEDTVVTQIDIRVTSSAGFAAADLVYLCDNTTTVPLVSNTISSIVDANTVRLDVPIGSVLLTNKNARLFKKLI